jgi:SAM-dependent methyltransferase
LLDLGCGPGRHSLELARRGFDVFGVDFVESFVAQAREGARIHGFSNAHFFHEDGRSIDLGPGTFPGAICLYDVVGTFPELDENERLLESITRHLSPGGRALLSVLNMELTRHIARRIHSIEADPLSLQTLPPSDLMQRSGAIFNPNFFLLDPGTGIVYRKEQFDGDGKPPGEFIVRDRRFTREGIQDLCSRVGLILHWARPFALGQWGRELEGTDPRAKEIVFLVERR